MKILKKALCCKKSSYTFFDTLDMSTLIIVEWIELNHHIQNQKLNYYNM